MPKPWFKWFQLGKRWCQVRVPVDASSKKLEALDEGNSTGGLYAGSRVLGIGMDTASMAWGKAQMFAGHSWFSYMLIIIWCSRDTKVRILNRKVQGLVTSCLLWQLPFSPPSGSLHSSHPAWVWASICARSFWLQNYLFVTSQITLNWPLELKLACLGSSLCFLRHLITLSWRRSLKGVCCNVLQWNSDFGYCTYPWRYLAGFGWNTAVQSTNVPLQADGLRINEACSLIWLLSVTKGRWVGDILRKNSPCVKCFQFMRMLSM